MVIFMRKNKRIIIKIGSSSLVLENGKLNQKNFETIISMIKKLNDKDKDVVFRYVLDYVNIYS